MVWDAQLSMFLTEEPPWTHVLDGECINIIVEYCSSC